MIIKGSRYTETVETRNGESVSVSFPTTYTSDSYYTVITYQDETFASLAYSHLKNSTMYWKIADLNRDLSYPDIIPAGTPIKVPLK